MLSLLPYGVPRSDLSYVFSDNPMVMLIVLLLLTIGISALIVYGRRRIK